MSETTTDSAALSDAEEIYKMPMLIVGMEKLTTQAVNTILSGSYTVVCAKNAEEAMNILATQEIHLVFVSLSLQEQSGLELLKTIKNSFPGMNVIIVSMNEGIDSMRRCYKEGAADVFQVPISAEMVRARVGILLQNSLLKRKLTYMGYERDADAEQRKSDVKAFQEMIHRVEQLTGEVEQSADDIASLEELIKQKDEEIAKEKQKSANFARLIVGAFSSKPNATPQPAEVPLCTIADSIPPPVMKEAKDMTQRISRASETPIQTLTRSVADIVRGDQKMKPADLKKALTQMVTSLSAEDLYKPQFKKLFKECGVDDMTRQWIIGEFQSEERRKATDPRLLDQVDFASMGDTSMLKDWGFNVFSFSHDALLSFIEGMFNEFGLLQRFKIDLKVFRNFLVELRQSFTQTPYHNYTHAFDTLQTIFLILTNTKVTKFLTKLDILALFIGALCQDIDHPGLNNLYQVNAQTPLALNYNDISVLENFHASRCFALLGRTELLKQLTSEEYIELRRNVISGILATDMSSHFTTLTRLATHIETKPFSRDSPDDRQLLICTLLHAADLSNTCKQWRICKRWSELMQEEFLQQGDKEVEQDLPRSPYMTRSNSNIAKMMTNMIDYCVYPLFSTLTRIFPELHICIVNLQANRLQFMQSIDEQRIPEIQLEDPMLIAGDGDKEGTDDEDWARGDRQFEDRSLPVDAEADESLAMAPSASSSSIPSSASGTISSGVFERSSLELKKGSKQSMGSSSGSMMVGTSVIEIGTSLSDSSNVRQPHSSMHKKPSSGPVPPITPPASGQVKPSLYQISVPESPQPLTPLGRSPFSPSYSQQVLSGGTPLSNESQDEADQSMSSAKHPGITTQKSAPVKKPPIRMISSGNSSTSSMPTYSGSGTLNMQSPSSASSSISMSSQMTHSSSSSGSSAIPSTPSSSSGAKRTRPGVMTVNTSQPLHKTLSSPGSVDGSRPKPATSSGRGTVRVVSVKKP
ncbi:3',5'-cyclic-AMP phosphodiesterase [Monocercomonoides exilis]|uniref:3',5'-cyclic-AMP phosphodiesterase n=1 Tax=Monocercomonoides exilis TaxID=2049356 RepID=UPI00355A44F9|nr:3',5'-cyclic-AMP phosphodiesterase [Monocercomonoides exilis]|eukprot:MONOS_6938.1-p1 / transcript=MONOS_6938.1 / gene=MONOS_6938 / organism=Monocercomonoides_exilis_PA203 / gene_product=3',5'-cyclic-AMP phosphodiesterase [EC:3.1.4.53/PDE] / transcript_product=3',5'-cyclic-AMP phosphodiesterase [EC:3.1.4.53/PDE] / location=Mono_scaffold00228:20248-23251(-) / protein_length=980 / sequence_SO=supercontig / SO=protein_coding / is_pseudo=false